MNIVKINRGDTNTDVFTHRKTSAADDGERSRVLFDPVRKREGRYESNQTPIQNPAEPVELIKFSSLEAENGPGHLSNADILHDNRFRFFFPSICAMVS